MYYSVEQGITDGDIGKWKYTYTWTDIKVGDNKAKDLSHFVIEVSPSFTASNLLSWTGSANLEGPKNHGPGYDSGNPGMPTATYGLKFKPTSKTPSLTVTLVSDRAPEWGDFYAKSGGGQMPDAIIAYNAGFGESHAIDLANFTKGCDGGAASGCSNMILRPDTVSNVVPIPAAAWLVGSALVGLAGLSRKKGKGSDTSDFIAA